jgi:hypothetical protein
MFGDLSGFTALSERIGPEEIRLMVDRCMSEMGQVVDRFGGTVDKVIGDALMAVFGAPVAHEDDSERAVRAALEIQRRASEQSHDFGELCVSIGVNTGEDIRPGRPARAAGADGDGRRREHPLPDYRLPPHPRLCWSARRLELRARGRSPTRRWSRSSRRARKPILAWLARAATSAPAERPVSAAPFIGRDSELELLARTWTRAASELHPQLVTLVGPPGIGKTRLTLEFAARVESAGGRIFSGRPLPYGAAASYWAFGQVIRDASGIFANDPADVASDKLAERAASLLPRPRRRKWRASLDHGPSRRGHRGRSAGAVRLRSAGSRGRRP